MFECRSRTPFSEPSYAAQNNRARPSSSGRSDSDREQLVVLIPPKHENKRLSQHSGFFGKPRLSVSELNNYNQAQS